MSVCMCGGCERCQPAGALESDERETCGECGEYSDDCECGSDLTCQECGEPDGHCECVCGYCLRIGLTCICDEGHDLDNAPELLVPWGGDR